MAHCGGSLRGSLSPSTKSVLNTRYSVVSNASSNTTSGIASDKMTISFEDDGEVLMVSYKQDQNKLVNLE